MSSTHSATPLACASILSVLNYFKCLDKDKLDNLISIFSERLALIRDYVIVKEINNTGLIAGLIFNNKEQADKISYLAMQKGVIVVNTGKNSIKLGPPLCITEDALLEGLDVIEECIEESS